MPAVAVHTFAPSPLSIPVNVVVVDAVTALGPAAPVAPVAHVAPVAPAAQVAPAAHVAPVSPLLATTSQYVPFVGRFPVLASMHVYEDPRYETVSFATYAVAPL